MSNPPPIPQGQTGRHALQALAGQRSILAALEILGNELGSVFRIPLPGFNAVVLAGPEAARFVLVDARNDLSWRPEGDPVVRLLRNGLLIKDGEPHDALRKMIDPTLQRRALPAYVEAMQRRTDQVIAEWRDGEARDMLVEMRRIALLILMDTLFAVDLTSDLDRLWPSILRLLEYISPGLWVVWPSLPRPGYGQARRDMDAYLYRIIAQRRSRSADGADLLTAMVHDPALNDDLIRDQLLTLLIAGHDTSTALLAWTLYLFGEHPGVMLRAQNEVDQAVGEEKPGWEHLPRLEYLDQVIKESLRLYPPIHAGNRLATRDLEFQGYRIPAGTRILYSIYLTHRQAEHWPEPDRFDPERFAPGQSASHSAYSYIPFGGGPRFCIGASFAQAEAKIILARLLQRFTFTPVPARVRPHMGATLEPRPGVPMKIQCREVLREQSFANPT